METTGIKNQLAAASIRVTPLRRRPITRAAQTPCPECDAPVQLASRFVQVRPDGVRVYCSADCLARGERAEARTRPGQRQTHPRSPRLSDPGWTGPTSAALRSIALTCKAAAQRLAAVGARLPARIEPLGDTLRRTLQSRCAAAGTALGRMADLLVGRIPARRPALRRLLVAGGATVAVAAALHNLPEPTATSQVLPVSASSALPTAALSVPRAPVAPGPAGRRPGPRETAAISGPAAQPAVIHGPSWPPTHEELATIMARDMWIHPLSGPEREMPRRDSRVFGAERPGDRPPECRNGHCGVDIGGQVGEPVLAAHEGVVERIQRGPNEERGGKYVRLSHRNDTVFTQYFHLHEIPDDLRVGDHVNAGQIIGSLGATGVKNSGPHLHFTISVQPSRSMHERFIDPEPLIALWPVAQVLSEGKAAMLSAEVTTGLPRGSQGRPDDPPARRGAKGPGANRSTTSRQRARTARSSDEKPRSARRDRDETGRSPALVEREPPPPTATANAAAEQPAAEIPSVSQPLTDDALTGR